MSDPKENWQAYKELLEDAKKEVDARQIGMASQLKAEFERLAKQLCPYCSGFGHSGKECPTDAKISHLRGGICSQNRVIQ